MPPPTPAAQRRALPAWLANPLRTSLHLLRRTLETTLLALFFGLSVRFALQLDHPAKWETWTATAWLRAATEPVIAWTADWLGFDWPARHVSFLPLGLALFVWMVRGMAAHRLELLRRRIRRPEGAEGVRIEDAERAWLVRAAGLKMAEHTTIAGAPPGDAKG